MKDQPIINIAATVTPTDAPGVKLKVEPRVETAVTVRPAIPHDLVLQVVGVAIAMVAHQMIRRK